MEIATVNQFFNLRNCLNAVFIIRKDNFFPNSGTVLYYLPIWKEVIRERMSIFYDVSFNF